MVFHVSNDEMVNKMLFKLQIQRVQSFQIVIFGHFSPPFFLFTFANLLLNLLLLYLFAKTRRKEKCQASPFWLSVWWCYFFLNNLKFSSTVIQFPIDSNTLFRMQKKMKKTHYREKKNIQRNIRIHRQLPNPIFWEKKRNKIHTGNCIPQTFVKTLGGEGGTMTFWLFGHIAHRTKILWNFVLLCDCVCKCV